MESIPAPPAVSTPPLWIPVTDRETGHTLLILESVYRHFSAKAGTLTLHLDLPPLAATRPTTDREERYSEPRTLAQWSDAFDMSPRTMHSWFKNGTVSARKAGRLWQVAERDIPSRS